MSYSIQMSGFSRKCRCKPFFERLSIAIKQVHVTLHLLAFFYIILCVFGKSIGSFDIRFLITLFPQLLLCVDVMFDEGKRL